MSEDVIRERIASNAESKKYYISPDDEKILKVQYAVCENPNSSKEEIRLFIMRSPEGFEKLERIVNDIRSERGDCEALGVPYSREWDDTHFLKAWYYALLCVSEQGDR